MAATEAMGVGASTQDLVCTRCWHDFFDTEAFEKCCTFHHAGGERADTYINSVAKVCEIRDANCNWCAYIRSFFQSSWMPDAKVNIHLSPSHIESCTPNGQNVFYLSIDCRSSVGKWMGGSSLFIHAWTTSDDNAAGYVTSRPVQTNVKSEAAKAQLKTWMEECTKHECCSASSQDVALPTRVIEASPPDQSNPRLIKSRNLRGLYATLSYCWGTTPFLTLTESNCNDMMEELDLQTLPLTIRDAISVARFLSIPYLWIDALCIIQDSKEDVTRHVGRMNEIYASSSLTIVAASAQGVHDGFLHTRSYSEPSQRIPVRIRRESYGTMCVNELDAASYDERLEPLAKRAWALQEQLLSQRTLTFTSRTMMWKCHAGTRNFGDSMYFPHDLDSGYNENDEKYSLNLNSLLLEPREAIVQKDKALSCWLRLVMAYSLRSASFERDKLNALAGIASHPSFSAALGPGYFAGLWQHELARQLLWRTASWHRMLADDESFNFYRPETYRAPSWSWASLEGGLIQFDHSFDDDDEATADVICAIMECSVAPVYPETSPFGEVAHAQMKMSAFCRWAWFDPSTSNILLSPASVSAPEVRTGYPSSENIITFADASTTHIDTFKARYPDVDLKEDPEATHGTDDRNMQGSCDETGINDPVKVLCVAIMLLGEKHDGVGGLLLVPSTMKSNRSVYKRIGCFERGRKEDFLQETKMEIVII